MNKTGSCFSQNLNQASSEFNKIRAGRYFKQEHQGITALLNLNGKVERSHQTDRTEFYATVGITDDNLELLLAEWQHYYNWDRPHSAHIMANRRWNVTFNWVTKPLTQMKPMNFMNLLLNEFKTRITR